MEQIVIIVTDDGVPNVSPPRAKVDYTFTSASHKERESAPIT